MTRAQLAVMSGLIGVAALGTEAYAQQDGALVELHERRREGRKVCMSEHTHSGSSTGQPNRKAAEVAAIRDWAGFTAWEYGDHWGNFNIAGSKRMSCTQGSGGWGCDIEARPCKPAR
jgi:hypothetical protein